MRLLCLLLPLQSVFFQWGTFRFFVHSKKRAARLLEKSGLKRMPEESVELIWAVLVFAARTES